jgi:hypothetical protein
MTALEIEKLNRVLTLLIDAYSESFQWIEALENNKTHGELVAFPAASKESALRQAHQELDKALRGLP